MVKEIEIKINIQAAWAYVGATVPSAAGISYRVDLILTSKQTGAVPLEPTSTTHSLPVYLPKIGS